MSDALAFEIKRYAFELLAQLHRTINEENIQPSALSRLCAGLGDDKRRAERTVHPYLELLFERAIEIRFETDDKTSDADFAAALHSLGFAVTVADMIQLGDVQRLRKLVYRYSNLMETTFAAVAAGVADRHVLETQLHPYLATLRHMRELLGVIAWFSTVRLVAPAAASSAELPDWGTLQRSIPDAFPALAPWLI